MLSFHREIVRVCLFHYFAPSRTSSFGALSSKLPMENINIQKVVTFKEDLEKAGISKVFLLKG